MRTRPAGPAAAGFTLIEVMISMFFLSFMVGEMAMISTYARRSSAYAQRVTEANMLAEAVLEKSRNTAWNNLNTRFSAARHPRGPDRLRPEPGRGRGELQRDLRERRRT